MHGWEDFLWLMTNPYFIAMLLSGFAIEPILRYLRRFYPESLQKASIEAENFRKELQKNKEDKKIYQKANLKAALFITGPTFILFFASLVYIFFTEIEFNPQCILKVFGSIAPFGIITFAIYFIYTDKVNRLLFKNDYEKVMELTYKHMGSDPLHKKFEKFAPIIGYFFLLLGVTTFIGQFFD